MTTRIRASGLILKNNQVLLMKRIRKGEEYWVFPGGGVEEYESHEEAAVREIAEETNLSVTKIIAHHTYPDPENPNTKHYFIVCEVSSGTPEIVGPEKTDHNDDDQYLPQWINISDALKLTKLYPVPIKNYLRDMQHDAHQPKSH